MQQNCCGKIRGTNVSTYVPDKIRMDERAQSVDKYIQLKWVRVNPSKTEHKNELKCSVIYPA